MGSNQFQREYIEYLQKCNTELLKRLNDMKESYENRILSKDLNKDYLISTLEDVLRIFTVIPQEIDLFFDKMTAAMGAFKDILLRKSEIIHLMDKISKALNSNENFNKLMPIEDSVLMKDQFQDLRLSKKGGTAKVSPMINGHIICTEPRIYLSRVPGMFTSGRSETLQLSPIIEASPDTSTDFSNLGCHILKEIKVPLERINLNKISYNYVNEESPKTRFKGPKLWKKSLSSNKSQSDYQRKSMFSENSENLNKKHSMGEGELPQKQDNIDPLEGPSWLYIENSGINSTSNNFIDFRRRKHRFATVFDKEEDCCINVEKKPRKSLKEDANEFYENRKRASDEEENFEEIYERFSESSEDFIYPSLTDENDENYSPFVQKRHRNNRRERSKEGSDEKVITKFDKKLKKKHSRAKKTKSISKTPIYSNSSDEEDNERKSLERNTKSRKSSGRRLQLMRESELSSEKTPSTSQHVEREACKSKKSKDSRRKTTSVKDELENDVQVQLNDDVDEEKNLLNRSKSSSVDEKKKYKKNKSKSKSRSPSVVFQEIRGRTKRKAAPTKLAEPKLKAKLRRN